MFGNAGFLSFIFLNGRERDVSNCTCGFWLLLKVQPLMKWVLDHSVSMNMCFWVLIPVIICSNERKKSAGLNLVHILRPRFDLPLTTFCHIVSNDWYFWKHMYLGLTGKKGLWYSSKSNDWYMYVSKCMWHDTTSNGARTRKSVTVILVSKDRDGQHNEWE